LKASRETGSCLSKLMNSAKPAGFTGCAVPQRGSARSGRSVFLPACTSCGANQQREPVAGTGVRRVFPAFRFRRFASRAGTVPVRARSSEILLRTRNRFIRSSCHIAVASSIKRPDRDGAVHLGHSGFLNTAYMSVLICCSRMKVRSNE
jgi:hypothetical protein